MPASINQIKKLKKKSPSMSPLSSLPLLAGRHAPPPQTVQPPQGGEGGAAAVTEE